MRGAARVVSWFSCGADSAQATKLAIEKYGLDTIVARIVIDSEDAGNYKAEDMSCGPLCQPPLFSAVGKDR